MNKFVILSFATMGWAFWSLSGGAAFDPKAKRMTESPVPPPAPVITANAVAPDAPKTRSLEKVAGGVPTVRLLPKSEQAPQVSNNVFAVTPDASVTPFETPQAVVVASSTTKTTAPTKSATPQLDAPDLRQVRGSRVNMRGGPGTGYSVLAVLSRGQEVRILSDESGWVKLRDQQSGKVGWMSAKMITPSDR